VIEALKGKWCISRLENPVNFPNNDSFSKV
jgi:hypothetical protein